MFRIRSVRDKQYRYIRNHMPERPFLQLNRYKERQYPVIKLMRELHAEGTLAPEPAVLLAPHRPAEELYDTIADPYEMVNLADSPEHQEVLERFRAELDRWIEEVNDQGRIPEPPEVVEAWKEKMNERYTPRPRK